MKINELAKQKKEVKEKIITLGVTLKQEDLNFLRQIAEEQYRSPSAVIKKVLDEYLDKIIKEKGIEI